MKLLHRPMLHGVEHLPKDRPYLLVANHSAGVAMSEIFSFMGLWLDHVGEDRPLAGFAHPLGLKLFPASAILRSVGAIPSTYEAAAHALAKGVPILVFPGGDYEALRPVWRAHEVDFGGRVGFLKIAREANVPIVPMGIRGSHFSAPILWRSRHVLPNALVLPRLVGLKRWALTLVGTAGAAGFMFGTSWTLAVRIAAAFAFLNSPLIFSPIVPATIRMTIGPPIEPEELFAEEDLARSLKRVERAVQSLVDA